MALDDKRGLIRRYYALSFIDNLTFTLPIWVLFGHDYLGVSYFVGITLISLPLVFSTLLSVPTGALADRWGRHHVYRLGMVFTIIGVLPFVLTKDVTLLLLSAPIAGLGLAMREGSLDAIISAAAKDRHDDIRVAISNQRFALFAGRIAGGVAGGALYVVDPRLPFLAGIVSSCVCLPLSMGLPANSTKTRAVTTGAIKQSIEVLRKDNGLRAVFAIACVSETVAKLTYVSYQPALKGSGFEESNFGFIFILFSLSSIAGTQIAKVLMKTQTATSLLRIFFVATFTTSLGVATCTDVALLLSTVPLQIGFGMIFPIVGTYTATRSPLHLKATLLSLLGVMFGAWAISAPLTGILLDTIGYRWVGVCAAVCAIVCTIAMPSK